jgi:hypothetical protein
VSYELELMDEVLISPAAHDSSDLSDEDLSEANGEEIRIEPDSDTGSDSDAEPEEVVAESEEGSEVISPYVFHLNNNC